MKKMFLKFQDVKGMKVKQMCDRIVLLREHLTIKIIVIIGKKEMMGPKMLQDQGGDLALRHFQVVAMTILN